MPRYRLSGSAKVDIAEALSTSEIRHGGDALIRYRGLLAAALRRIAADPKGRSTSDRAELRAGLCRFHIRHIRNDSLGASVHEFFYRAIEPDLVEIVRVMHERMAPSGHVVGDRG
jgi:toxin ParE1/3/4